MRTWLKEVFHFLPGKRFRSNLASRGDCIYHCALSALADAVLATAFPVSVTAGPHIETAGHVLAFVDHRWLDFAINLYP